MPTARATRTRAVLAAAACGALVLSGCSKPAPGVTVWSGTTSAHREALCWAYDADNLAAGACASDIVDSAAKGGRLARIAVVPGSTVGISVDTKVAAAGWTPVIDGSKLTSSPITDTYYRFTFPQVQIPEAGYVLQVVAGQDTRTKGVWAFTLVSAAK